MYSFIDLTILLLSQNLTKSDLPPNMFHYKENLQDIRFSNNNNGVDVDGLGMLKTYEYTHEGNLANFSWTMKEEYEYNIYDEENNLIENSTKFNFQNGTTQIDIMNHYSIKLNVDSELYHGNNLKKLNKIVRQKYVNHFKIDDFIFK